MKKFTRILPVLMLSFFLFSGIVSAHVTVYPKEVKQGAYEKFAVRVPSEKDIPTVKIEVKIPGEVDVTRVEPKPGWKYEFSKDASDKVVSITWTAEGQGLLATEFTEFNMSGKVGNTAESITWKAYQTYQDGSVVEWVGAPDAEKPASVTKILPSTGDKHGDATPVSSDQPAAPNSNTPLYLSIAALILGIASFVISLLKRAR